MVTLVVASSQRRPLGGDLAGSRPIRSAATGSSKRVRSNINILSGAMGVLSTLRSNPSALNRLITTANLTQPATRHLTVTLRHRHFMLHSRRNQFMLNSHFTRLTTTTNRSHLLATTNPVLRALLSHANRSTRVCHHRNSRHIYVTTIRHASNLHSSVPINTVLSVRTNSTTRVLLT